MKPLQLLNCVAITSFSLLGCTESSTSPAETTPTQPTAQQSASKQPSAATPSAEAGSIENSGHDVTITDPVESQPASKPDPDTQSPIVYGHQFPEVLAVELKQRQGNRWLFNVTLSSPYDSPQRYADAWRVLDDQDKELGIRILGHDHASEQPFTRSATIELPDGVAPVFVEGRDQANGWSGQRFKVTLP